MTTDLDVLIAELRACVERGVYSGGGYFYVEVAPEDANAAADALESTLAELRQERERADSLEANRRLWIADAFEYETVALSRAEETIENARLWLTDERMSVEQKIAGAIANLTEYDKQKGVSDD